jgi:hypothetical protein
VGAEVHILGNKLTGTTAVTFNGIAATFAVVSETEIATTVPSGATSGFVAVTTPKGVLKTHTVHAPVVIGGCSDDGDDTPWRRIAMGSRIAAGP